MLTCTPDAGIVPPPPLSYEDLYVVAKAACATFDDLKAHSPAIDKPPTDRDKVEAENVLFKIVDPALKIPNPAKTLSNPASVSHLSSILQEFDKQVIQSAVQLRTYVTNRLIVESDNADARIRIKALELLGRISDVGLFTDRAELTISNRATTDLEAKLREKLSKLLETREGQVRMGDSIIDVDVELGLRHDAAHTK